MKIYYQRVMDFVYNLDIDRFIESIMANYINNKGKTWKELNFQDEDTVYCFLNNFGDNLEYYLEKYGCELCEYFTDDDLVEIYDEVVYRMEELNIIKKVD